MQVTWKGCWHGKVLMRWCVWNPCKQTPQLLPSLRSLCLSCNTCVGRLYIMWAGIPSRSVTCLWLYTWQNKYSILTPKKSQNHKVINSTIDKWVLVYMKQLTDYHKNKLTLFCSFLLHLTFMFYTAVNYFSGSLNKYWIILQQVHKHTSVSYEWCTSIIFSRIHWLLLLLSVKYSLTEFWTSEFSTVNQLQNSATTDGKS